MASRLTTKNFGMRQAVAVSEPDASSRTEVRELSPQGPQSEFRNCQKAGESVETDEESEVQFIEQES